MVKGEVSQDEERKHVTRSAHMQKKKKKKLGTEVKEIALCQKKQNETTTCYLYLPRETALDRNMALKQPGPVT